MAWQCRRQNPQLIWGVASKNEKQHHRWGEGTHGRFSSASPGVGAAPAHQPEKQEGHPWHLRGPWTSFTSHWIWWHMPSCHLWPARFLKGRRVGPHNMLLPAARSSSPRKAGRGVGPEWQGVWYVSEGVGVQRGQILLSREITLDLERKIMEMSKFHFQPSIWLYGEENSVTTFR